MKTSFVLALSGLAAYASASAPTFEKRSKNIDTTILNYALTLEHLEANFYHQALEKFSAKDFTDAGFPAVVRERMVEVGQQEATHAKVLTSVLGSKATKACTYNFPYKTVPEFLALSRLIEGVGVSAYLGAAPLLTSKTLLEAAGAIVTVEARHQSELATFLGGDGAPGAFDTPLGFSQVYTLAAGFIKSCPSSNPALPVQAFPALAIKTSAPAPGKTISFNFAAKANETYYAHFLNGLNDIAVKLTKESAVVPKGLAGRVYVIVSTSKTLSDKTTVAGPAIFEVAA